MHETKTLFGLSAVFSMMNFRNIRNRFLKDSGKGSLSFYSLPPHRKNWKMRQGYNAVNIKNGYKELEIRSPREFMIYEDNN